MHQRPRVVRRRSPVWRWVFVLGIGITLGVLGGLGYKFLSITHTSPVELFKRPFEGQRFFRVLVLGEDNTHKSRETGRGLSDTILVAAVDLDAKSVKGISIPRDTRIEVSGHGAQKINAAYTLGGPELAVQAAQAVLGVPIDYYVKTDIAGLKNIVDLVGGVGIEIEKNMRYTDRRGGLYINLKKGYRHLDGDKALQYVRFRHDTLGDISRIQRQQKFLRALARQMLSKDNWGRLPSIVTQIYEKGYVETNFNAKDLLTLSRLARDIPPDQMEMETVPTYSRIIDGISYQEADLVKTAEIVDRLLQPPHAVPAKVAVLNGSGASGKAKEVADLLEKEGFKITTTGNAESFDYEDSRIILHSAASDSADRIAQLIGCSDIRKDEKPDTAINGEDITVIIGRDYGR